MDEKILEAQAGFNRIVDFVTGEAVGQEIAVVELRIFRDLLGLGRVLLELFLKTVGTGHVGDTLTRSDGIVMRYLRDSPKQYLSVFGKIVINRAYYLSTEGKGACPLDAQLNLPKRLYSYLLQKWMTLCAVRVTYKEASCWMGEFLGLKVAHRPIERVAQDLTPAATEFTDLVGTPDASEEGPILIESLDRKGIPMCKPDPNARKSPDKPGKKKQALVTATASVDFRESRPVEELADCIMGDGKKKSGHKRTRRNKPHHKLIIASLTDDKDAMMEKAQRVAMPRIHDKTQYKAVVGDGEKKIWSYADELFPGWIQILDIIHAKDKLLIAAHLHYPKGSDDAHDYVKERLLALLNGEVDSVIEDFAITLDDGTLCKSKVKILRSKVLGYFETNRGRMRYDEFLKLGLPIGSGLIEGTCKNLINDRMERSGMRWSPEGAEAILKLRALHLTDHWSDFWEFSIAREKRTLYGSYPLSQQETTFQMDILRVA